MRRIYRNIQGTKITNIVQYAKDFLKENPDGKIHVGTDSQNTRKKTLYATVIAFQFNKKGVHIIYVKRTFPKIKDRFTRLWKEAEYSVDAAIFLRDNYIPINRIELDYNKDKTAGSNMVLNAGTGYVRGMNFEVASKPEELIATKAADHIIRH